jgi:tryptophan-rich sensory protein
MATTTAIPIHHDALLDADRHDLLGLVLSAALPLAVFVIANGIAQLNGTVPLFFSPLGMPGWLGAALHIGCLPLFGVARWMVADRGEHGRIAGWWLVALIAGVIAFPFLVTPLDSLLLSIAAMALLVLSLAVMVRVARVSQRAAWVMLPGLAWLGFSAFIGLTFVASWAPPFALTNAQATHT